jgi:hypothetical protein
MAPLSGDDQGSAYQFAMVIAFGRPDVRFMDLVVATQYQSWFFRCVQTGRYLQLIVLESLLIRVAYQCMWERQLLIAFMYQCIR